MKPIIYSLISCFVLLLLSAPAYSVVVEKPAENQEVKAEENAKEAFRNFSPKKQKRLKKRMKRLKNKLSKAPALDSGIFQQPKFRLGLICLAAGLALILLASIFFGLGGLIFWIGDLAALIGVVLMIWGVIEYV